MSRICVNGRSECAGGGCGLAEVLHSQAIAPTFFSGQRPFTPLFRPFAAKPLIPGFPSDMMGVLSKRDPVWNRPGKGE